MAAQAITAQDIKALGGRTDPRLESGVPSLLALLRRLRTWYQQNRRYRETVAELGKLSDHLLADIGIERHQIGEVARAAHGVHPRPRLQGLGEELGAATASRPNGAPGR